MAAVRTAMHLHRKYAIFDEVILHCMMQMQEMATLSTNSTTHPRPSLRPLSPGHSPSSDALQADHSSLVSVSVAIDTLSHQPSCAGFWSCAMASFGKSCEAVRWGACHRLGRGMDFEGCSRCGHIHDKLFAGPNLECGLVIDRDCNAARNLWDKFRTEILHMPRQSAPPSTVARNALIWEPGMGNDRVASDGRRSKNVIRIESRRSAKQQSTCCLWTCSALPSGARGICPPAAL